jgi:hypothetical protein
MRVYCHATVSHAQRVASTVHDASLLPIHYSQNTYTTALPGPIPSRHVPSWSFAQPPAAKRSRQL